MQANEIRARIEEVCDDLPKLPAVVTELLAIIDDENGTPEQVVKVLEPDPALTTRILRVANSAYYGFSQSIHELRRAVPLIGLDMVRSLALSLGVVGGLSAGGGQTDCYLDGLWLHSLTVGNGCNALARKLGFRSEHIFITAFLHDIGKLVLNRTFPDEFKACLDESGRRGMAVFELEREIMGMDHGEIGAILLEKWQFPEIIIQPVRYHHTRETGNAASKIDLAMIRVLDILCHKLGVRAEPLEVEVPLYKNDLELLGLDRKTLLEFTEELKDSIEDNRSLYSAMT